MASIAAWKRFLASNPEAQREYRTLELWHSQLAQTYRFVSNYSDINLTLESTAPRNPGQTVAFRGVTLEITEPAERQDAEQALSVIFGNVDDTVTDIMDQISGQGFLEPIQVVYRKYYSGDLSQPATSPLYLFASSVAFEGPAAVSFTAEDVDLSQKRAGTRYTLEQFPGLRP